MLRIVASRIGVATENRVRKIGQGIDRMERRIVSGVLGVPMVEVTPDKRRGSNHSHSHKNNHKKSSN